jgi:hypothetical protein
MPKRVIDIDRGMKAMVRRFKRDQRGPYVTVGIQGTEASQTREFGQTNVAIAAVHEFGSRDGHIPQRSFLRSTMDREHSRLLKLLEMGVKKTALTGADVTMTLSTVGEVARAACVRTIDQSIGLKPNAPATIKRKRSTTPLIDEGILKRSITWKVHKA